MYVEELTRNSAKLTIFNAQAEFDEIMRYWLAAEMLVIVFAGVTAGISFRPVPRNFLHYLGWRLTVGVPSKQEDISYNGHSAIIWFKVTASRFCSAPWKTKQSTELVFLADTLAGFRQGGRSC